ncbi:MAG: hypothetical protein FH749_14050 [Firmicutes bacterium]|nr:hypothetical protein [Bacillota bacterium]
MTKIVKIGVVIALLVIIAITIVITYLGRDLSYTVALLINWGIKLPTNYEVIYRIDPGQTPFGDGFRYSILYYEKGVSEPFLDDFSSQQDLELEQGVEEILNHLSIDKENAIDFSQPYLWKSDTFIPSEREGIVTKAIFLIFQPSTNYLYVVHFKI